MVLAAPLLWAALVVLLPGSRGAPAWCESTDARIRKDKRVFERYNDEARQAVFFARNEAGRLGASSIDTEHLLLGVFRSGKAVVSRILRTHQLETEVIASEIEARGKLGQEVAASLDMPLTPAGKKALDYAEQEAAQMGAKQVGAEHILLGLIRERRGFAAGALLDRGLDLDTARDEIRRLIMGSK